MLISPRILSLAHCFTFVTYLTGDTLFTRSMLNKKLTLSQKELNLNISLHYNTFSCRTRNLIIFFLILSFLTYEKQKCWLILANACWLIYPETPPLYSGIPPPIFLPHSSISVDSTTVFPVIKSHTKNHISMCWVSSPLLLFLLILGSRKFIIFVLQFFTTPKFSFLQSYM